MCWVTSHQMAALGKNRDVCSFHKETATLSSERTVFPGRLLLDLVYREPLGRLRYRYSVLTTGSTFNKCPTTPLYFLTSCRQQGLSRPERLRCSSPPLSPYINVHVCMYLCGRTVYAAALLKPAEQQRDPRCQTPSKHVDSQTSIWMESDATPGSDPGEVCTDMNPQVYRGKHLMFVRSLRLSMLFCLTLFAGGRKKKVFDFETILKKSCRTVATKREIK